MEDLILKIFILVLIVDSIESKAKNLMSERIFIRIIISQIIMMSILIKIKLNRERHYKYRNWSEWEKETKRECGRNRYRNMAKNWKKPAKGVLKKLFDFKTLILLY